MFNGKWTTCGLIESHVESHISISRIIHLEIEDKTRSHQISPDGGHDCLLSPKQKSNTVIKNYIGHFTGMIVSH